MPSHIRPQLTVDTALLLSDAGVPDVQTAEICGVAVKTVGRWRRLYQRRGVVRGANLPPPCFRCEGGGLDAGAYSYLFGLYLGDGHLVAGPRGGWRRWTRSSARSTDAGLVAVPTTRRPGREPDAPVIVPAVRPQLKTPQPISRTSTAAGPSTQPA